jgi:hypothetical protein
MISLKKKLKHLPADKIAGLEFVTGKIIETGLAEMVVLYGSHARSDYKDGKIKEVSGIPIIDGFTWHGNIQAVKPFFPITDRSTL